MGGSGVWVRGWFHRALVLVDLRWDCAVFANVGLESWGGGEGGFV